MKGLGKKAAAKKDAVEENKRAPQAVEANENSAAPEVKKGRGKAKAKFEEVQVHKESENLVASETDTKEKRGRSRQTSSKKGTEKPAKTSEEQLHDEIESSLPAVPVVETKEKRGRGRQAKTPVEAPVEASIEAQEAAPAKGSRGKKAVVSAVSEVDSEEEAVEEMKETKAKGKKGVAVTKKKVEKGKSAVPEDEKEIKKGRKHGEVVENHPVEVEAPVAEIKEKKGRGKNAQSRAKAEEINPLHEDIPEPVAEEKAVEVTAGPKPKTGPKSKVGFKSRKETKPTEEEDKSPSVAEPEVAEKKGRGKKARPSADSTSQAASEVDTPDAMAGAGLSTSGGDVASSDDHATAPYRNRQKTSSSDQTLAIAFKEIVTMAGKLKLPVAAVDKAKQLFKDVHNGKHLKGYSNHLIASACLHIACRQQGRTITFKQICAVSNFGIKGIGKVFKKILKALETSVNIITIGDFMPRFCLDLGLPIEVQMTASHIGRRSMELDIVPGRSPISVAAAAIYMASQASEKKLTKKEIGETAEVADVTIRQSYELMYPHAAELFPADFKLVLSELPQR